MPIERVLQELARLYLQNMQLNDQIIALQAQVADQQKKIDASTPPAAKE